MGQITRTCPHCHTQSVSFQSFGEVQKPNTILYTTSFFCGGCYGGYVAEIECRVNPSAHGFHGNIEATAGGHYTIFREYPIPTQVNSPKHLPDNLEKFYLQAANSIKSGNFDASSMMSRKVLEVAVKILAPESRGSLYQRIESLANAGSITPELKDWAHIIRDNGNDAAHEEAPVSVEFAEELLSFSEMFLMYTFTMPGMVASRRHDGESA